MENASTTIQKRNLALATNVLDALKEARTTSSAERPAWTVILREAALLASRDFGLPDTREILDLNDEAKDFAWGLYYSFLASLTDVCKLHTELQVPLQYVSVGNVDMSVLEQHRAELEKLLLVDRQKESVATVFCSGRPIKILYVDSLAAYSFDDRPPAQSVVNIVYEFKPKKTAAPKNLRKGPPVRGTSGKIRKW